MSITINQRAYSCGNFDESIEINPNSFFDLDYLVALEVAGDKTAEFLQGQLSCDMRQVSATQCQQGLICNLKGRVMAIVDVIFWQNSYYLITSRDQAGYIMESLGKIAPLSRVKLNQRDDLRLWGFYGCKVDALHDLWQLPLAQEKYAMTSNSNNGGYNIGENFIIIITKTANKPATIYGSHHWHHLRLSEKAVELYPDTRGLFLPHRLGFHETGHISFTKGCYKGQEIIARMHYRSTVKHQLKIFLITTPHPLQAGKRLLHDNLEIGELIDWSPISTERYLIAASMINGHPDTAIIEGQKVGLKLINYPEIA